MALRVATSASLTGLAGIAVREGWKQLLAKAIVTEVSSRVESAITEVVGIESSDLRICGHIFWVGGGILLLEWSPLILKCVRLLVGSLIYILASLLAVWCWLCSLSTWLIISSLRCASLSCSTNRRAERGALTCDGMALVAAGAAGHNFQIGSFAVVSRPPNYDEIWVAGHGPGQGEVLGRTTTDDGADWKWVVVQPVAGQMMSPTLVGDGRRPPHGVQAAHVNWICIPPNADAKWVPAPGEAMVLIRDATVLLSQLQAAGPGSYAVNVAGAPGSLEEVTRPIAPVVAPVVGVPNPPAEGAGGGGPGVAALGLGGDQVNNPGSSQLDLKALEAAVAQLQALSLKDPVKGKKRGKKGKKDDKKKKSKKGKKKKKRGSSSSSSSSRSRSRSSASSTSSSSSTDSGKRKPLRWKEKGRDRRVSYEDLAHVDGLKWKKKGDLIAFAMKNPGALTGHFLAGVCARLSKGTLARTSQLRDVSVAAWAHQFTGLTEVRDLKEVLTLAEILDSVNRREIARAMDILCQRILAIQAAKLKGGSWEKAESIELVNTQRSLASTSMLALTNA